MDRSKSDFLSTDLPSLGNQDLAIYWIRHSGLLRDYNTLRNNFPMVSLFRIYGKWCADTSESQPIHGFWDKNVPSHCISGDKILIVPGAFNAVLDGLVILLVR